MPDADDDLAAILCALKAGSVVAAAGCGKTEQIVKATKHGAGRHLILTHTHAGVDTLRRRLRDHDVPTDRYAVDTIAGWCLRFAASYPLRSGLTIKEPRSDDAWLAVYEAARRLLASGTISRVLAISYRGVFVDEYQDCGMAQHGVVVALAAILPVCVFGDPLQAIFDFKGQSPVDWEAGVFPLFPVVRKLSKPHRWHKYGNTRMADWLEGARTALEAGDALDFNPRSTPGCVSWASLPQDNRRRQSAVIGACQAAMPLEGTLVVIGDPKNLDGRAALAKQLSKQGFSNIEPIEGKDLHTVAAKLMSGLGPARLDAMLTFLGRCLAGTERADFEKAVMAREKGKKLGTANFGELVDIGLAISQGAGDEACLALIDGFYRRQTTYPYRRELLSAMRSALKIKVTGGVSDLSDAVWLVQNKIRHAGRIIAHRSVGSTLLVKGLEFAHVIVVHSPSMSRKDWYVAITRATHSLKVLSPERRFIPPP